MHVWLVTLPSLGKEYIRDPDVDEMFFSLLSHLSNMALNTFDEIKSDVNQIDELDFTAKLLPFVLELFMEHYRNGYLRFAVTGWDVYYENDDAE